MGVITSRDVTGALLLFISFLFQRTGARGGVLCFRTEMMRDEVFAPRLRGLYKGGLERGTEVGARG